MDTVAQQYRRRAADVEKLAKNALNEYQRRAILHIAEQWRELADQREQQNRRWADKPLLHSNCG